MTKPKKFRPQKQFNMETKTVSFRSIEPRLGEGTFSMKLRAWKNVRGHSTMDIHDIHISSLQKVELLWLHKQIQEAIKKDLDHNIEMAKRFGVTP